MRQIAKCNLCALTPDFIGKIQLAIFAAGKIWAL
jgi:hypothetical protein